MSEARKNKQRIKEYLVGDILDIGCGDDPICESAMTIDKHFQGANLNVDASVTLPFESNRFHTVHSSHMLEDIANPQVALREWCRVLRNGGVLLLYLPHKAYYPNIGEQHANKAHQYDFLPHEVAEMIFNIDGILIERMEIFPPPKGKYMYEIRGEIEYSFLIVARKAWSIEN